MKPESRVGKQIRSFHPWAYKRGEWGTITSVTRNCGHGNEAEGCYQIQWPDGATDDWAIIDPVARYEFRDAK